MDPSSNTGVVSHVVVVGFHHKKGCIVEYAYPPLIEGNPHNSPAVPEEWKHLPFLALPDGAHNFTEDTIYFHLPPRKGSHTGTVYCISCYRQIDASLLKKKDKDVTRGTVQKSVVVLSTLPLYGLLHAKLQLITHAYFEEKDFSQKHILKELYDHINISVARVDESHRYIGLSARNLVLNFQHKIVMLFKLILLERRVLFFTSPVHRLVGAIMALLSLFPRMIEIGLTECTSLPDTTENLQQKNIDNKISGNNVYSISVEDGASENNENFPMVSESVKMADDVAVNRGESEEGQNGFVLSSLRTETEPIINPSKVWQATSSRAKDVASSITAKLGSLSTSITSGYSEQDSSKQTLDIPADLEDGDDETFILEFGNAKLEMTVDSPSKSSSPPSYSTSIHSEIMASSNSGDENYIRVQEEIDLKTTLDIDEFGFPLSIFTKGHLCLPYVSLQQYDVLASNIRQGFVAGATNALFKSRHQMSDVVVDVESREFIYHDNGLRRLLHLSAADLRFAEHLVSKVCEMGNQDVFLDATGWEGGDEWIQSLFAEYLHGMLALSQEVCPDPKNMHDYNENFMAAWKQTKNYKIWKNGNHNAMNGLVHPFHGQYSVSDMKLRIYHNLQSSERGRRLEGTLSNANQVVSNTGKFVGSALASAKTSMSSWFSTKLSNNQDKVKYDAKMEEGDGNH